MGLIKHATVIFLQIQVLATLAELKAWVHNFSRLPYLPG